MIRFSYSNISTYSQCPFRWYLQYKQRLKVIPDTEPNNPLWLGLALHKGIEDGSVESAINEYKSHYNIITNENLNWIMQLEYQLPRVFDILPQDGEHELEVKTDDFIGYIDYVCGDTLYDFKFSNNIKNYEHSPQLPIYKYYLEKVRPDIKINHLKYLFVPKVNIRQKKTETLYEFRQRLVEELEQTQVQLISVDYDETMVTHFQECCQHLNTVTDFPKNKTRLCSWCPYQKYCESDGKIDYMIEGV